MKFLNHKRLIFGFTSMLNHWYPVHSRGSWELALWVLFLGFDLLILRTVPTCSWQLFIGNISSSTIPDFVTMRLKQAHMFKLTKILISKNVGRDKRQAWVNAQFIRNDLK